MRDLLQMYMPVHGVETTTWPRTSWLRLREQAFIPVDARFNMSRGLLSRPPLEIGATP